MRVIAGTARHIQLKTLDTDETRPTTDRIKETLFNMLHFELPGSRFLDLFSGSGGIGIEALSRGAAHAVFVEQNPKAAALIRDNLERCRLDGQAQLLVRDCAAAVAWLQERDEGFDFIFMDPPYGRGLEKPVLQRLAAGTLLRPGASIIVEAEKSTDFSYVEAFGLSCVKEKLYKSNKHVFLQRAGEATL